MHSVSRSMLSMSWALAATRVSRVGAGPASCGAASMAMLGGGARAGWARVVRNTGGTPSWETALVVKATTETPAVRATAQRKNTDNGGSVQCAVGVVPRRD